MDPLAIVLVLTVQTPALGVRVEARPVVSMPICQQLMRYYLTPPGPAYRDEAAKRAAVCLAVPVGGKDM